MRVDLQVVSGRSAPLMLSLEAASESQASARALELGYTVLSTKSSGWTLASRARIRDATTRFDVVVFVEQLRDLLNAGLSLPEAVGTLRQGLSGSAADAVAELERRLREGLSFSQALEASPAFPGLLVALVRASELTSDLPRTLSRFLEHEERVAEVRHRIVSTAVYPLLLVGVGGVVLLFLLFYVVPRFARIFEGMTGTLPWSARVMIGWGEFLRSSGGWWLAGAVVLLIAGVFVLATPSTRARMAQRLFESKPLRRRLRTYFLARWYRATGMLVEGGIPLAGSLALTNGLLPLGLRAGGDRVEQAVREGLLPAHAHVRGDMATPVAVQLLLAGERSGDLGGVLSRIARFHEAEVSRSLERSMRAFEPVVMVLIGLGVGIVVVLMYLPIFELASAIQ
jgi:general secretion pathway protein F